MIVERGNPESLPTLGKAGRKASRQGCGNKKLPAGLRQVEKRMPPCNGVDRALPNPPAGGCRPYDCAQGRLRPRQVLHCEIIWRTVVMKERK